MDPYLELLLLPIVLIILLVVYLAVRVATAWGWRRVVEPIVVGQIAAVVRQNLPLASALALASDSESGIAAVHLRRISKLVAEGLSLSQALRLGFPDCSALVLSLITAGEQAGQLPAALDQAEAYLIEQARRRQRYDASVRPYLVIIMLATVLIVSGMMVAVVPKLHEIFKLFGVALPAVTLTLIDISRFFAVWGGPLVGLAVVLIPIGMYLSFRPRRLHKLGLTSRIADWVRWHTPGFRRLELGRGMAVMLRTMRLAVGAGLDLEPAVRLAAQIDVNAQLRPRMLRFAELLQGGMAAPAAAREANLGQVAIVALASGARSGDMDTALRYAAEYYDAIISRWWIVLNRLAWPACTLAMATVVGFVVVACFVPLVALINATAGGG